MELVDIFSSRAEGSMVGILGQFTTYKVLYMYYNKLNKI